MAKLDFDKLNSMQRYTQWAVFKVEPGALPTEAHARGDIIAQAKEFFEKVEQGGDVVIRGLYLASGIQANGDFIIWWHAEEFSQIQEVLNQFRRETVLGQLSEISWIGNGLHRPAEFNKSHLPSFIMGEDPGNWLTIYPFVRSYDWYLLDPQERRAILAEHGANARDYPDVRANTVPAFALGDYEWLLAFEAPTLDRTVDLMHTMRYTRARLHVREEIPFYSGERMGVEELIKALP